MWAFLFPAGRQYLAGQKHRAGGFGRVGAGAGIFDISKVKAGAVPPAGNLLELLPPMRLHGILLRVLVIAVQCAAIHIDCSCGIVDAFHAGPSIFKALTPDRIMAGRWSSMHRSFELNK